MKQQIIAGLDIGNGYVKGLASVPGKDSTGIDFPSAAVPHRSGDGIPTPLSEAGGVIADIFNQMEISISSSMVPSTSRMFIGSRGLTSASVMEFDVNSMVSKATQELSFILVFACLAGKALQVYWEQKGTLPRDTVQVNANIAVALPITEYKVHRSNYAAKLKKGTHVVTFHNFDELVRVELAIDDVQVLAEGASAQYAINAKGEPLMNAMLKDMRARDPEKAKPFKSLTGADILAAKNTVGIDIGEGTVNFPVYQNGKFNSDDSATFRHGYGRILTEALGRLQAQGYPFQSRKALGEFLQQEVRPTNAGIHAAVNRVVEEATEDFAMSAQQEFSKLMGKVGVYTEVVFVYGGGATPVKEALYPRLLQTVTNIGGGMASCPILYLDSAYSRKLNREGLYVVASQMYAYLRKQKRAVQAEAGK